jgi:acetolactate synthase-1/2/3 large subunit
MTEKETSMVTRKDVHAEKDVLPALHCARVAIAMTGKPAVINVWTDPGECAPGTNK